MIRIGRGTGRGRRARELLGCDDPHVVEAGVWLLAGLPTSDLQALERSAVPESDFPGCLWASHASGGRKLGRLVPRLQTGAGSADERVGIVQTLSADHEVPNAAVRRDGERGRGREREGKSEP